MTGTIPMTEITPTVENITEEKRCTNGIFDKEIWKDMSDQLSGMIKDCQYTGQPDSYLSIQY